MNLEFVTVPGLRTFTTGLKTGNDVIIESIQGERQALPFCEW